MKIPIPNAPIHPINSPILNRKKIQWDVLREDLNHPLIMGNKFRKLKYNLIQAQKEGSKTLLTFGGAYSNHILATAAAAHSFGFNSVGIIRGEELANKTLNPTLKQAQSLGMKLEFVSRENYRIKHTKDFLNQYQQKFEKAYILPEGGTNELAVKGSEEILSPATSSYDFITVAVGTAGTISGIIRAANEQQKILGFPALKDSNFLHNEIKKYTLRLNYDFINAFHFGGYAKINLELITFVNRFWKEHQIPIEPIYTGKMFWGINQMITENYFPQGSRILSVHSGGLQGIAGINQRLKNIKIEVEI